MRLQKGYNIPKLFKAFVRACPPLYMLLCTKKNEYRTYKTVAGFIYGLALGIGFYFLIIVDLDFTEDGAFFFGTLICLVFAYGTAVSSQIRCISLLAIPNTAGKVGRGFLKGIVLAILIAGPLANLGYNGLQVVDVFTCSLSLVFNITSSRVKLSLQPFAQAFIKIKDNIYEVKDTVMNIKDISAPLIGEVEDETEMKKIKEENDYLDELQGDTKRSEDSNRSIDMTNISKSEHLEAERYQKLYVKKIQSRCESQFTKATMNCRKLFAKGYGLCYDTFTWVASWLLCWPMKLEFICNIAEALGGVGSCDPSKVVDPGFGDGYTYLKESRKTFSKQFKEVRVQFKIDKLPIVNDVKDAKNTGIAILHAFTVRKELLEYAMTIVKRLIALLVLRVFVKSQQYHNKYLRNIEYDNIYITKYFRKIDARRKAEGKYMLLPLKKVERKKLIDPWSLMPAEAETKKFLMETLKLLLEMITVTTFVLLDRMFYESLEVVRKHAKMGYVQTGRHDIKLQIKGTGIIAGILKYLIKGLNIKKRIHVDSTTDACLPKPRLLLHYYIYKMYGIYLIIWLLLFFQSYTKRLRRIICSYFYRKREKRRILFLYNESLKKRIGFLRVMKKKVKQMSREYRIKQNLNVFMILTIKYPQYCKFLRIFSSARRKCLMCEEPETFSGHGFVECPTYYCHMIYCTECWVDLEEKCYACLDIDADTSSGIESIDDDDDEEDD